MSDMNHKRKFNSRENKWVNGTYVIHSAILALAFRQIGRYSCDILAKFN